MNKILESLIYFIGSMIVGIISISPIVATVSIAGFALIEYVALV